MCLEGGSSSKSELPVLDEILKEVYALPGGAKPITFNNQAANVPEKIQYEICTLRSITFMSNIDKKSYEQCRASYRK
ncbi:hypothetical protein CJD38_14840 [Stenotrophobium rhamnosiphilum]|uniref:Uncharacterized protein n=2 Tax=Stenotrophobium rhamnosiphilum TaxID=2029166 RepID=A0A2T5MCD4_9GAMM|nr:hypothetical protein CJD38_14840 [Stenotrophobium rhamnosiphilum]